MIILDDAKKGLLFKMLASKPLYEVGLEFGLDKNYKDSRSVSNAVYRIYQQVRKEPAKYMITPEVCDMVVGALSNRSAVNAGNAGSIVGGKTETLREKNDALQHQEVKEMIQGGKRKTILIINKKLDRINKSKKLLDETNLATLATVFGILFDKAQIANGEATENVAILAKIDPNMNPQDAIAMVLKMREINNADKEKKAK